MMAMYEGFILVKQRIAEENDVQYSNIPFQTVAQKGELLLEIPAKDRIPREDGTPIHNYCLHNDPTSDPTARPTVSLFDDGTGVRPLQGAEFDYLIAIKNPTTRILQYFDTEKMKWIMDLKMNDDVFIRLKITKSAPPLLVKGRVRYYGLVKGYSGVMFGIEIMVCYYGIEIEILVCYCTWNEVNSMGTQNATCTYIT